MRSHYFWMLIAIMLTSCTAGTPDPLGISWTAERPDTQISSTLVGSDLRVTIESPTGIGGATLILPPSAGRVVLLLRLQGLEELRLRYGSTTVIGGIASGDQHDIHQAVVPPGGDPTAPRPIEPSSPFWMPMRLVARSPTTTPTVPLGDGWVEVELPPDARTSGQRTLELHWIDFFR